jgi:Hemolysin coregulated protein Hcp (TssD)
MIKIKFEIEGKEYPLDNVNYSFVPSTPDNIIASVNLNASIKSQKMDQSLLDWCLRGASDRKDIKIYIYQADDDSLLKTVKFKNAMCSSFNESFYPTDGYNPYPINLSINAEDLIIELKGKK